MILVAFVWFVLWGLGSAALCLIGWLLVWAVQGWGEASAFTNAWLFTFNGIIVGAAGYGAVFFIRRERGLALRAVKDVLDVPESMRGDFDRHVKCVESCRTTFLVAFVMTAIGGFIAYNAGIPLRGFAHIFLSAAVISYYWVGALGLMVFVAWLRLFRYVETHAGTQQEERISLRSPLRNRDLQMVDLYFIISAAMAIFAVYICFRTTLTAFHEAPLVYYKAMIIPVLFFLPAALVYTFYPRWVLREVWETDTFVAVEKFAEGAEAGEAGDLKRSLEMRKLIMEVKEKMVAERRAAPLFTFKDAPTLTMAILMLLQLVAQKDPILLEYFRTAFR